MIIDVMESGDARVNGRLGIVDRYSSFTWIDRFFSPGEFTLKLDYSDYLFQLLAPKNVLYLPENGKRAQYITSRVVSRTAPGHYSLTIKGQDPRIFLDRRIVLHGYSFGGPGPSYVPKDELNTILEENIGDAAGSFRSMSSILRFEFSAAGYTTDTEVYIPAGTTLEKAIYTMIDSGGTLPTSKVGARLLTPSDYYPTTTYRTMELNKWASLPFVVFSPKYDSGELTQMESVLSDKPNWGVGYGDGVYPNQRFKASIITGPTGIERYERGVSVSGVKASPEVSDKWEVLLQRAAQELVEDSYNSKNAIEFESYENGPYRYGIDYDIGDLVRVESEVGRIPKNTPARVIEYVISDDESGLHEYPVLSV